MSYCFNVSFISLPMNFCILLSPKSIKVLNLNNNDYVFCKGTNKQISIFKILKYNECQNGTVLVPYSVQLTLGLSKNDKIPILPFNGDEYCEAIKIRPLFDDIENECDYKSIVIDFFTKDTQPISVDSIFILKVDGVDRIFQIINCKPKDRSFSNSSTKLYFEECKYVKKVLYLPIKFENLILEKETIDFVNEFVLQQYSFPKILTQLKIETSIGILIYGEQGCGKTYLLSAICNKLKCPSIYCNAAGLKNLKIDIYYEEINKIFDFYPDKLPCLIMIDNINEIIGVIEDMQTVSDKRKTIYFISKLEETLKKPGMIFISTSDSINSIEPKLLRNGRLSFVHELMNPSKIGVRELIKKATSGMVISDSDLDFIIDKIGTNSTFKEIETICSQTLFSVIEDITGSHDIPIDESLMINTLNSKIYPADFGFYS